jgi:hypothetical protein
VFCPSIYFGKVQAILEISYRESISEILFCPFKIILRNVGEIVESFQKYRIVAHPYVNTDKRQIFDSL